MRMELQRICAHVMEDCRRAESSVASWLDESALLSEKTPSRKTLLYKVEGLRRT